MDITIIDLMWTVIGILGCYAWDRDQLINRRARRAQEIKEINEMV